MTETTKTCARQWPATAEFFRQRPRKIRDGAEVDPYLQAMCLSCDRKRVRLAQAKSRTTKGRADRTEEHRQKRERSALKHGFASVEQWDAHRAKTAAGRKLAAALKAVAKQRTPTEPDVCWLRNRPGLNSSEKFRIRYRLDAEFRATQIQRTRMRKPHLKLATPAWVDRKKLASIYADRPHGRHVDHIVPIKGVTHDGRRVSGLNVPWNLRYLPASDNIRRSNRMTAEELAEHERCNQGCDPYNPANGTHSDQRSSAAPRHQ